LSKKTIAARKNLVRGAAAFADHVVPVLLAAGSGCAQRLGGDPSADLFDLIHVQFARPTADQYSMVIHVFSPLLKFGSNERAQAFQKLCGKTGDAHRAVPAFKQLALAGISIEGESRGRKRAGGQGTEAAAYDRGFLFVQFTCTTANQHSVLVIHASFSFFLILDPMKGPSSSKVAVEQDGKGSVRRRPRSKS